MPLIPRVKVPERRDQVVSFEQEAKLYEGCDHFAKDTGQRVVWWLFRHFVMWALDLGFRKGELLAFKLSDLTFARNDETGEEGWVAPVKANGTKTGQAKAVPLTARVWESVETFKRMGLPEDEPIFGSTLTVGKVQEMWTKLCEYAGMADYHIHDLRHTAATRWRKRGIPLDLIARMLGHASPEITYKVYQHLDPSDLVDAVRKSEKSRPQLRVVGE
jgi:integrase